MIVVDVVGDRGTAILPFFFVAVAVRQPEDLYESVYVGCFHHLPSKPLFVEKKTVPVSNS